MFSSDLDFLSISLAALALFCLFVAICLFLPLLTIGKIITEDWRLRFEAIDSSRKTFAQIFGGAAIIFTFAWAFLKDTQTLDQSRRQLANDLYVKSAELMASSDSTAARTAGIFALGSVANARSEFQMAVRDSLAAFIREQADSLSKSASTAPLRQDVQAALEVLGRRDLKKDPDRYLDLRFSYLTRPNFFGLSGFRSALFQDAKIFGSDFRYSDLSAANSDLSAANMDQVVLADYQASKHLRRNNGTMIMLMTMHGKDGQGITT